MRMCRYLSHSEQLRVFFFFAYTSQTILIRYILNLGQEGKMCLSSETCRAIKARMREIGMSQKELAEKLRVSPGYVSNVLTMKRPISMEQADRIVKAIGGQIRVKIE